MATRTDKAELRQVMGARRELLDARERELCARRLCDRVMSTPWFVDAHLVVGYVAMRQEIDPYRVLQAGFDAGKWVGLPRLEDGRLVLRQVGRDDPLEAGPFGVQQPLASAPAVAPASVDLVLVPALAVDSRGFRLGYGKGFYDRLLPELPGATSVAITYDFQVVDEAPIEDGDVAVDVVITDRRTMVTDP